MKTLWLWTRLLFWKARRTNALRFRADLDDIVARERARAEYDVRETEVLARRAEMELIQHRADRAIAARRVV